MKQFRNKQREGQDLSPPKALELLAHGNERFQSNLKVNRDLLEQVNITADGQFPFAVVLSCIDSRTSAELIFDQGLGDIFSIRIAGNILNDDIIGSMEFACAVAGSKLIVVVGHSSCGAIKGACDGVELEHLSGLLARVLPVVRDVEKEGLPKGAEFMQRVSEKNVDFVVQQIKEQSQTLNGLITTGEVGLVGAMYSVGSGRVVFGDLLCGDKNP